MPNTTTAVIETAFAAARQTPEELTGFLGAVTPSYRDEDGTIAAVEEGGTVKIPVVPRLSVGAAPAASMTFTAGNDRVISTIDFTLNQTAQVSWNLTGDDERRLTRGGTNNDILKQTLEQGFRSLRNQIEAHVGLVACQNASRALGTPGTAPFASNFDLTADAKKELDDNGALGGVRSLIMNTTGSNGLRKQTNLTAVYAAGSADPLRKGVLLDLNGFAMRESAGVNAFTKGTMTGALINGAGMVAGSTALTFDTGTPGGTGFKAGDVIAIAGVAGKYVVKTGLVAASGTITIQEPGLLAAAADNAAITVENSYAGNIALDRGAIQVAVRPALQPEGKNVEQEIITDPATGFSALFRRVVGDRLVSWYLNSVYDAFAPNPYGIIIVRG